MAVANYHDTYGALPPAYLADAAGRPMHSWRVLLLPFLDQRDLYEAYDFNEPWDGPNNRKLIAQRPNVYALHDKASQTGTDTNYLAVVGAETAWPGATPLRYDEVGDGTSDTILIVENVGSGIAWTAPRDLSFETMPLNLAVASPEGISSRYTPPAAVTLDGRVRTLHLELPMEGLRALLTANGGDYVEAGGTTVIRDGRQRPVQK